MSTPVLHGPRINGAAVLALRLARGDSQVALAKRAQLDHSYISRIERGQRCYPAPSVTKALADALGVPLAAILVDPGVLAGAEGVTNDQPRVQAG